MRVFCLFFSVVFMSLLSNAQDEVPFTLHKQFYLKGDAFYIGNNILSKNTTSPYSSYTIINDAIYMKYIDVDNDPSTFSSSKASFNLSDKAAKIVSATLYWSGVYPYSKGTRGVKKDTYYYKKAKDREGDFTQVKFKTPKSKDYHNIKGHVLFDGLQNEDYKDNAPYVCYTDVTHLLSQSSNANGEYTVANVKATEGYVSGGSTAGWFLFIVYESNNQKEHYITTYNGFSTLSKNAVDIEFKDFKTNSSEDSNATIFVATLEGDSKLSRDQCGIVNPETKRIQYLNNTLRAQTNFFNGRMTIDNKYFTKRTPNGRNTLGFDVLKLKLPTSLIKTNQTNITLRLESKADRYYFYFSAFKTQINKDFYNSKVKLKDTVQVLADTLVKPIVKPKDTLQVLTHQEELKFKEILKSNTLNIPGLESGLYIITNVFSIQKNAIKWQEFLISKGHEAKIFQNPKNNWYYVHIYNDIDVFKVYKKHEKLVKLDYFKEIWVFKIN